MSLGARIEQRMHELHLTQSELARRAKVPQTTMNSLIRGPSRWSPHLVKIARVLRTTPAYLTAETDDPDAEAPVNDVTSEEEEWIDLLRNVEPKDRAAILQLARTLAHSARSPTIHDKGATYKA